MALCCVIRRLEASGFMAYAEPVMRLRLCKKGDVEVDGLFALENAELVSLWV
jgi:hypothetical protein